MRCGWMPMNMSPGRAVLPEVWVSSGRAHVVSGNAADVLRVAEQGGRPRLEKRQQVIGDALFVSGWCRVRKVGSGLPTFLTGTHSPISRLFRILSSDVG